MTECPILQKAEDLSLQVLSHHPELMVVAFCFAKEGATEPLHHHPTTRFTHVESGRFRFTLGDAQHEIGAGESLTIPSGLSHGCTCLRPGTLIDSFSP